MKAGGILRECRSVKGYMSIEMKICKVTEGYTDDMATKVHGAWSNSRASRTTKKSISVPAEACDKAETVPTDKAEKPAWKDGKSLTCDAGWYSSDTTAP